MSAHPSGEFGTRTVIVGSQGLFQSDPRAGPATRCWPIDLWPGAGFPNNVALCERPDPERQTISEEERPSRIAGPSSRSLLTARTGGTEALPLASGGDACSRIRGTLLSP